MSAIEPTAAKEPGVLTVLTDMFKGGLACAVMGAVLGAAAGGVLSLITPGFELFGFSGIADGALLGAVAGSVIGIPCGCVKGVGEIRHYYEDIAIPQIKEAELSKGKLIGAELEQTAAGLEQESQRYRSMITQNGKYTDLASLEKMEPMGRA